MPAKPVCVLTSLALLAPACALGAGAPRTPDQNHGLGGTAALDAGLYVAYCPGGSARHHDQVLSAPAPAPEAAGEPTEGASSPNAEAASVAEGTPFDTGEESEPPARDEGDVSAGSRGPLAAAASTSEAGWPAKQCLKMDKGAAGHSHTLVGLNGVHNWLLGGYGNDTIIGGNHGDVIWADYHPSGEPRSQTAQIHAGNGRNVIYANDTHNYVWTGTNPRTVVHAHVSGISGVIHCQSAAIVVYLSTVSERHFTLDGCRRISHYSVGY
ncbi:MAG TPA: hypothetical protein VNZ05_07065 [Solirubrobacteraceae bacterium]|nr:hypothetical protein [Solirubrobacteraceae bacterium]